LLRFEEAGSSPKQQLVFNRGGTDGDVEMEDAVAAMEGHKRKEISPYKANVGGAGFTSLVDADNGVIVEVNRREFENLPPLVKEAMDAVAKHLSISPARLVETAVEVSLAPQQPLYTPTVTNDNMPTPAPLSRPRGTLFQFYMSLSRVARVFLLSSARPAISPVHAGLLQWQERG
jgi:hypothetical protein